MAAAHRFINSPVGTLYLESDGERLTKLLFGQQTQVGEPRNAVLAECEVQLTEYFSGKRQEFDLPLAPKGTPFEQEVWAALLRIPYGETRSYGVIAKEIGRPDAARAVGAANGRNPISIIVPCHRVVGADGSLTGYGGGLSIKRQLLDLERPQASLF